MDILDVPAQTPPFPDSQLPREGKPPLPASYDQVEVGELGLGPIDRTAALTMPSDCLNFPGIPGGLLAKELRYSWPTDWSIGGVNHTMQEEVFSVAKRPGRGRCAVASHPLW
jgi:hypothetical protein